MLSLFKSVKTNREFITLKTSNEGYLIEAKKASTHIETKILIDFSGKIKEYQWNKQMNFQKIGQVLQLTAFLGILNILNVNFLVFVEEAEEVCILDEREIFEIKKVQLFAMATSSQQGQQEISKEVKQLKERIEKILSFGHYFSFGTALTLSFQSQQQRENSLNAPQFEERFFWNYSMMMPLIRQNISSAWHLQVIQGFVKNFTSCLQSNFFIKYYLISRRSVFRSGTRCNHRGVDMDGNTANFVEHESIYVINMGQNIISHIQIRGSLPILWEQNGIKGKIQLVGGEQISVNSFRKHFRDIIQTYGHIHSISLMADKRAGEKLLTSTFKEHFEQLPELHPYVSFDTFDIAHHCKGGVYENINPYVQNNTAILHNQGYFLHNTPNLQTGIIRTNCKSSLDRTNIFQSKIEMSVLQNVLKDIYGFSFKETFGMDAVDMMEANSKKKTSEQQARALQNDFVKQFKLLWSENGDHISNHYAGTNALTSHATRTGTTGIFGKIRGKLSSIKRLYEGTFQDSHKQEAIDLILGRHSDSQKPLQYIDELNQQALLRQSQFLLSQQISVFIATWGLNRILPRNSNLISIAPLFDFKHLKAPDILVVCFQKKPEFKIDLIDHLEVHRTEKAFWISVIQKSLATAISLRNEQETEYAEVDFHTGGELMTVILAKKSVIGVINAVEHDDLNSNSVGKGAVVVKMSINKTRVCFINAHLTRGQSKMAERIAQVNEIHQRSFQREGISKFKRDKIEKSDKIFLIGCLNFKVALDFNDSIRRISRMQDAPTNNNNNNSQQQPNNQLALIKSYLAFDQFLSVQNSLASSQTTTLFPAKKGYLSNYIEGEINFMPTHKYQINKNSYNFLMERAASWCDRILMWNNEHNNFLQMLEESDQEINPEFFFDKDSPNISKTFRNGLPLFYDRIEIDSTPRRPITGYFLITVKDEDSETKDRLFDEIAYKQHSRLRSNDSNPQMGLPEFSCGLISSDNPNANSTWIGQMTPAAPNIFSSDRSNNSNNTNEQGNGDEDDDDEESDEDEFDDEDADIQGQYDEINIDSYEIDPTKLAPVGGRKKPYKISEDLTSQNTNKFQLNSIPLIPTSDIKQDPAKQPPLFSDELVNLNEEQKNDVSATDPPPERKSSIVKFHNAVGKIIQMQRETDSSPPSLVLSKYPSEIIAFQPRRLHPDSLNSSPEVSQQFPKIPVNHYQQSNYAQQQQQQQHLLREEKQDQSSNNAAHINQNEINATDSQQLKISYQSATSPAEIGMSEKRKNGAVISVPLKNAFNVSQFLNQQSQTGKLERNNFPSEFAFNRSLRMSMKQTQKESEMNILFSKSQVNPLLTTTTETKQGLRSPQKTNQKNDFAVSDFQVFSSSSSSSQKGKSKAISNSPPASQQLSQLTSLQDPMQKQSSQSQQQLSQEQSTSAPPTQGADFISTEKWLEGPKSCSEYKVDFDAQKELFGTAILIKPPSQDNQQQQPNNLSNSSISNNSSNNSKGSSKE